MECIFAFCCDKGIANSLQMFFFLVMKSQIYLQLRTDQIKMSW